MEFLRLPFGPETWKKLFIHKDWNKPKGAEASSSSSSWSESMASRDEERRIAYMNLKKMIYSIWHNDAAISLNLCRTDLSVSLQIWLLEFCLEGLLNEVRHRNKTGERSQKR